MKMHNSHCWEDLVVSNVCPKMLTSVLLCLWTCHHVYIDSKQCIDNISTITFYPMVYFIEKLHDVTENMSKSYCGYPKCCILTVLILHISR